MRHYQAADELNVVANCVAFSVSPQAKRRKVNQHLSRYTFPDTSFLLIYPTRSLASAYHPAWTGSAGDVHLGPLVNVPLRVNR